MRRPLLIAALSLSVAAVATTAVAAPTRSASSSITVKVPVPAPGSGEGMGFTVKVPGGKGKPVVHVLNDSAFGNASAVAAVGVPKAQGATTTYAFVILVRSFPSRDLAQAEDNIDVQISLTGNHTLKKFRISRVHDVGCSFYAALDRAFEGKSSAILLYTGTHEVFTLESIRPPSKQDSPPEEVVDNVLAIVMPVEHCSTKPEGDDAGPG